MLIQTNINNTQSDAALLIKTLADLSREIENRLAQEGKAGREAFAARVKSLMTDVPDLPNFSRFHDAFRENPKAVSNEGHMRPAFFMAYDESNCEFVKLASKEVDERLKNGPEMISANFVIPYPPGFPIMVPGQVITEDTITFMRKLDVTGDPRLSRGTGHQAPQARSAGCARWERQGSMSAGLAARHLRRH